MNDPNGPIFFDGFYHLFYQYNPFGDGWGNIHWGHARSADLVHWEHLPIALAPSHEKGETHCFSGCAVLDGGIPTILYTSVGEGPRNARFGAEQWMARSRDGMETWEKEPSPILTSADNSGQEILEWRDPFVWRERDEWQMVLGGSLDGIGRILRYRSRDLHKWDYLGVLYTDENYPLLECPNLLTIGEKRVLVYSPDAAVRYHVGTIDPAGHFLVEKSGILDHSNRDFYAPNTLLNDPKGRLLMWGWLRDEGRGSTFSGWAGAMSIPRVLSLDEQGLLQDPAEEYEQLRQTEERLPAHALQNERAAFGHRGRALELSVEAEPAAGDTFSIVLLATPDGREQTRLRYRADTCELVLEKGISSITPDTDKHFQRAVVPLQNGKLSLRIFLDHSVLEVFANRREAISGRVYATQPNADQIYLEGTVRQVNASLWPMADAQAVEVRVPAQAAAASPA